MARPSKSRDQPPSLVPASQYPTRQIVENRLRVVLELQSMMRSRIFDDGFFAGRELVDILARAGVIDNAILAGQHEQDRALHTPGCAAKVEVEPGAFHQESRRCLAQGQAIFSDEFLPVRRSREQVRFVERNGKPLRRGHHSRKRNSQSLPRSWPHLGLESRGEQSHPVEQTGKSKTQASAKFSAPGNG